MNKYNHYVKALFYGLPGVGKTTLASKAPHPFFICSDGNYSWTDLPEEDHVQVYSWKEAVKVFNELNTAKYDKYDTVVVDLLEDLFKFNENDFCRENKIDHVSVLPYSRGYNITRDRFVVEISKLLGVNKHVILIMHETTKVEKDRRGVEIYKYSPSDALPIKVLDKIEGKVRYCLRCYLKAEEGEGGKLIKKRYLSLIPKENEYGISRGLDEGDVPDDITLDWNTFCEIIGVKQISSGEKFVPADIKVADESVPSTSANAPVIKPVATPKPVASPKPVAKPVSPSIKTFVPLTEAISGPVNDPVIEAAPTAQPAASPAPAAKPAESQADKLARIKSMLANRK